MTQSDDGTSEVFIDAVAERIRSKLPKAQAELAEPFARKYLSQVDPRICPKRTIDDLYGAVLSHLNFVRKHTGGTRIRVYNPHLEEHGWESTHTVIEIVGDDMSFLVDSIGIEVNRQGLTLHLIIHPVMRLVRDAKGVLLRMAADDSEGQYESIIHVEVDRRTEPSDLQALQDGLTHILTDVRAAVSDWPAMVERLNEIIAGVGHPPSPEDPRTSPKPRRFSNGWLPTISCCWAVGTTSWKAAAARTNCTS